MPKPLKRLPAGCIEDKDAAGNVRIYFVKKIRMRSKPGTPEFMTEYERIRGGMDEGAQGGQGLTWKGLCERYCDESDKFKGLDAHGQRSRRGILKSTYAMCGDVLVGTLTSDHVERLRDQKSALPGAANKRLKAMRAVFKWALSKKGFKDLIRDDPTSGVAFLKVHSDGYHTWTHEEGKRFEKYHPIGSKPRLALALMLYLGVRRSDAIRLGRQHVHVGADGTKEITFKVHKGRNIKPKTLTLPVLPVLQEIIAVSPTGDLNFLETEAGKPWTDAGFGNTFRGWCDAAHLYHCTAHGLRKAAAVACAENGASAFQLMSIFGWSSLEMAEKYVRAVDQKKLAAGSIHFLEQK
jgi:integrase